jgi:hypothetical protein
MPKSMDGPLAKPIEHAARFSVGFVLGVLAIPALGVATLIGVIGGSAALHPGGDASEKPFVLTISGADVSRAGGVLSVSERVSDKVQLDCLEACDDLRIEDGKGFLRSVQILGPGRDCILCREPTPNERRQGNVWSVSGERLTLTQGDAK